MNQATTKFGGGEFPEIATPSARNDRGVGLPRFPFTEPVLSRMRFFATLRMTRGEGFRALAHRNDREGYSSVV